MNNDAREKPGSPDRSDRHLYEVQVLQDGRVVSDLAAGLMWHQSGSEFIMLHAEALYWLKDLNSRGYAGFSDWRLPTLEEGLALLECEKMNGDLYIDPVFSGRQEWIWTSDGWEPEYYWVVRFSLGGKAPYSHQHCAYVRPVRREK
jgi:hypothetical protein